MKYALLSWRSLGAGLLLGALAGCGGGGRPAVSSAAPDWRTTITQADRTRLRDWRPAWVTALGKARAAGAGAKINAEGALLLPDAVLDANLPPDGAYRCRTIKIGAKDPGGAAYTAYPAFSCAIGGGRLTKLTGSQRPSGRLYAADGGRVVFVGAMALGDEAGTIPYGHDPDRDMVGFVERVGPRRWRLVMPYPRWESLLDVMELVPEG